MAKGDYVVIKSEIGGKLDESTVKVASNGGRLEVKTERDGKTTVTVLNRNDKPTGERHTFFAGAIRSIKENLTSDA